nr:NUDIX hydrolase [Chthoniobacterales bacterium]
MQKTNLVRDGDGWETVDSETHFRTPHLSVATDEVRTPTQAARKWSVVHRKPAVVIAALTAEGRFVLIREERIPIRAAIWAMPAGQIDGSLEPDEAAISEVARRELREETGYELEPGAELVSLGHFFSSPGMTDEHCYLFLARPVRKSAAGAAHDETEAIVDCREFGADVVR